mmetsp:Transcript_5111/g.9777  ORF Transcript_5111/g.9777 Transcript_5111/m.9777 type:complete len:83 (+) Transcript_5111:17-265(+)
MQNKASYTQYSVSCQPEAILSFHQPWQRPVHKDPMTSPAAGFPTEMTTGSDSCLENDLELKSDDDFLDTQPRALTNAELVVT